MNQIVKNPIVKAREVVVSFHVDETNRDEVLNIDTLRKRGAHGFPNHTDLKLTGYITVHNVLAIEGIEFIPAEDRKQNYLDGSSNPRRAYVIFRLIVLDVKDVVLSNENLLAGAEPERLASSGTQVRRIDHR